MSQLVNCSQFVPLLTRLCNSLHKTDFLSWKQDWFSVFNSDASQSNDVNQDNSKEIIPSALECFTINHL